MNDTFSLYVYYAIKKLLTLKEHKNIFVKKTVDKVTEYVLYFKLLVSTARFGHIF